MRKLHPVLIFFSDPSGLFREDRRVPAFWPPLHFGFLSTWPCFRRSPPGDVHPVSVEPLYRLLFNRWSVFRWLMIALIPARWAKSFRNHPVCSSGPLRFPFRYQEGKNLSCEPLPASVSGGCGRPHLIKRHLSHVMPYITHPVTGTVNEWVNSKFQTIEQRAYGF